MEIMGLLKGILVDQSKVCLERTLKRRQQVVVQPGTKAKGS